ncbi:MAG: hypothetical protein IIW97_00600 [Alistipes sp.]|nr:hypothetical protein [Alistipes sp.]
MKYLSILLALLFVVACEPTVDNPDTPTPPNTEDDGKDDGKDDSWMDEVIDTSDANYLFKDGITGRVMFLESYGLSNDYISLNDNATGLTLFLDLYSPMVYDYVTPGIYTFGDGAAMTVHREYCYIRFPDETLMRFTDGRVKVIADPEHSSGYPYYHITARFVNEAEEVIVADYEGQLIEQ